MQYALSSDEMRSVEARSDEVGELRSSDANTAIYSPSESYRTVSWKLRDRLREIVRGIFLGCSTTEDAIFGRIVSLAARCGRFLYRCLDVARSSCVLLSICLSVGYDCEALQKWLNRQRLFGDRMAYRLACEVHFGKYE